MIRVLVIFLFCISSIASAQVYESEAMPHQIGRADGDGWSASTNLDPPGYMVYGPYAQIANQGKGCTAHVRMMVDNNNANNHPVARIDVWDATAGKRLALRTLTRKQFLRPWAYQDFQISFFHTQGHLIEIRTLWLGKSYVRQDKVTVTEALLDARLIQPPYGEGWRLSGNPMRFSKNISIDSKYWDVVDQDGVTLYERIEELWCYLGTEAGIGAYRVDDGASIYYRYAPFEQVVQMNGGGGLVSGYYHIAPPVLVTSGRLKDMFGGGPLGRNSAIRIPGYATMKLWGWADRWESNSLSNPNLSGPVPAIVDSYERWWLGSFAGPRWLIKE